MAPHLESSPWSFVLSWRICMDVTGPGLRFRVIWVLLEFILGLVLGPFEHPGVKLGAWGSVSEARGALEASFWRPWIFLEPKRGALEVNAAPKHFPRDFYWAAGVQFVAKLVPRWEENVWEVVLVRIFSLTVSRHGVSGAKSKSFDKKTWKHNKFAKLRDVHQPW